MKPKLDMNWDNITLIDRVNLLHDLARMLLRDHEKRIRQLEHKSRIKYNETKDRKAA